MRYFRLVILPSIGLCKSLDNKHTERLIRFLPIAVAAVFR